MQTFPEVKRLEARFRETLVVIGVHSAKFSNERESVGIRKAILRHGIAHPVVNDATFKIWRRYGIRGWPTLVLIDPEGYVVWAGSGEGHGDSIAEMLAKLSPEYEKKGALKKGEMKFKAESESTGALAFPGKIAAAGGRLFIADSGHNRIVVTDLDGKIQFTIGSGKEGAADGDFEKSSFNHPQGLAISGDTLYIADTENHKIRRADLSKKKVETIAGTGARGSYRGGFGDAKKTALASPWDLALDGDRLFIANAGTHQIWVMRLKEGVAGPFSGDGGENIVDGPHDAAQFAQPSGLALAGGKLYVADSEVSGVREIDADAKGAARTIVGKGLFEFGDKDGVGDDVRLQHAIGILWHEGKLFVADTYNHKIKIVDPKERSSKTFLGDGKPGADDLPAGRRDGKSPRFHEPSGLALANGKLFIADTNNHAIRVCDVKSGDVSTLKIK